MRRFESSRPSQHNLVHSDHMGYGVTPLSGRALLFGIGLFPHLVLFFTVIPERILLLIPELCSGVVRQAMRVPFACRRERTLHRALGITFVRLARVCREGAA
ncbi:MAG: hypothetical protein J2P54_16365 [Bradyrhizobiaceae bacterium]|nr:hypothetical protein [Bradyrhizobiaceae bacterium]